MKLWIKYFLSCLTVIAAYTGVIGTLYAILPYSSFNLAVIACLLLTLLAVILLLRKERVGYVQQRLHVIFDRLREKVDPDKIYQLLGIVNYFGIQDDVKDDVSDIVGEIICTKPDPTERYWLYISLGMIGGRKAESILYDRSQTDNNEFAKKGAEEAKELLRKSKQNRKKDKILGSHYIAEYLLTGLTLILCVIITAVAIYHKSFFTESANKIQNKTSIETTHIQRASNRNIVIGIRKGGDITIKIDNGEGNVLEIGIKPSIFMSYLEVRI